MARKRISLNEVVDITEPVRREKQENLGFTIKDFLEKHNEFMMVKKLEGLAPKPKLSYSVCAGKPGWNVKFQKGGQSFGTFAV